MRKVVLLLTLLSLSVTSFVPMSFAVDLIPSETKQTQKRAPQNKNDLLENTLWLQISESLEKEEAEEKLLMGILNDQTAKASRADHLLLDLYAIPPERYYLPYEPPIA